jgi:hypothetical protein
VVLWDVASGKVALRRPGHQGEVDEIAFGRDARTLLTGSRDCTALLWDLKPPVNSAEAAQLWADLAGDDADAAWRAIWSLAGRADGVAFLTGKLMPARPPADVARVRRLIADLDHETFAVRESATKELAKQAAVYEPELRRTSLRPASAEKRRRLQALLESHRPWPTGNQLRDLRAVTALEMAGTAEARRALEALAKGDPEARLTHAAADSLRRLR